jgi:HEAT repeat protein
MNLNIAVGIGGMAWYAVCAPQAILQVFVKNHLGASASALGLLVALTQLTAPFYLVSVFIYRRLRTRKAFWIVSTVIHRLLGFVLAGVAVYAAGGGATSFGTSLIIGASVVSFILATLSASGWWSWMGDLVPEGVRGAFFGRRSAIIHIANTLWFFAITVALDRAEAAGRAWVFWTYAAVFAASGLVGVADIVLHGFIPEPRKPRDEANQGWADFLEPVRNPNFLVFSMAIGLWTFAVSVLGPFVAPYITAKDHIGAPNTWLGITSAITQVVWIVVVAPWGLVMDRFGRKPAVILGALHPIVAWVGYFFLTPGNYMYILPIGALAAGVLGPGYWNGAAMLMLTLTPPRNRTAFIAWHSTLAGLVAAGGSLAGGLLGDALQHVRLDLPGGLVMQSFHVVALASLALLGASFALLGRIREGRERPVGYVASRLANPGIFRTFMNIGVITGPSTRERTARALRTMDGASGDLAIADVLRRLDDPDPEVRDEAVRALGRIRAADAVPALMDRLGDPHSTIRPQAARALGRIGDLRAVPCLIEHLASPSEELQDACAQALGEIGGQDSVRRLKRLLTEPRAERVLVSGAEAVSRHGIIEAAWEILPRMHETPNPVLRRQLAIAMGNLLGEPGQFYQYLTGERTREGIRLGRLLRAARRTLASAHLPPGDPGGQAAARDELLEELQRVRGLMEGQSYRAAVEGLYQILGRFARMLVGQEGPDDVVLDYAFARDARLGLGLWFVAEVKHRMGRVADPELLQIDALLALYFVSAYRPPMEPPANA